MPKFKYCLSCRYKDRILKYCKKEGKYYKLYYTKNDFMIIKFCKNNSHEYIEINIDDMINFMEFVMMRNYHCGGVCDFYCKSDMRDAPLLDIKKEKESENNNNNFVNENNGFFITENYEKCDTKTKIYDYSITNLLDPKKSGLDNSTDESSSDSNDNSDDNSSEEEEDDDDLSCKHKCKHRYYIMEYVRYIFKHNMMDHIKLFLKKHDACDFEGLYGSLSLVGEEDDKGCDDLSYEVISNALELSNYKISKYVVCYIYAEPHKILDRLCENLKLSEIKKYLRICTSKKYFESISEKQFKNEYLGLSRTLWLVARYNNVDMFKFVIEEFSKVKNRVDEKYQKDLIFDKKVMQEVLRLNEGKYNIVKYLIENGVNIQARNNEALIRACNENLKIVKLLVENGANIHAKNDKSLVQASNNGHLDIVKYLIKKGANINADNGKALTYACSNGHLNTVKYLVENGANIHANNNRALEIALEYEYKKIVKYLVKNGADFKNKN
ncbi:ankyrin repeat protein [Moumouvirus australiensis]|uniref:Ankyrin repeat protein n=1 Tax=Moumouvirus australiensis TaxID=2109587 RepID=A0A2P1EMX6_9VIRU|nr:ankyrin repeat protein [Moumouvirus australiensis]AVL95222.1 ankyrin repeat protein [Moumouvirus australiensis]